MKLLANKIIRILIWSDILIISGFGLISPIFAVFITDQIQGGSLEVAGLASTVYLLSKSIFQLPLARLMDKIRGKRDEFSMMLLGSLIISLTPLFYFWVRNPLQLFLVQGFYGIGGALVYPAWLALFTSHVDRDKLAFEWSIYGTGADVGGAIAAGVGGFLAGKFGFKPLFLIVSLVSFTGSLLLLTISRYLKRIK